MSPIIIDIDQSVNTIQDEQRIDMRRWHAKLRYGCSWHSMKKLSDDLDLCLPPSHGPVLIGSGDFHHLSLPLIARHHGAPLRVVVFDNHPDNMRLPMGVHCGSWISHVAVLPQVSHVDVVGITSSDMTISHAYEHRLSPLVRGKLTYWTMGVNVRWFSRVGLAHAVKSFPSSRSLIEAFCQNALNNPAATYLSIDKDVLRKDQVQTNWDQGVLTIPELQEAILALSGRIVGADITGEISSFKYPQWYKRLLATLDGQADAFTPSELVKHQVKQHQCNTTLLTTLASAMHGVR